MNKRLVGILRLSDNPAALYAADRIEELEAERDALLKAVEAARAALGKPPEAEEAS